MIQEATKTRHLTGASAFSDRVVNVRELNRKKIVNKIKTNLEQRLGAISNKSKKTKQQQLIHSSIKGQIPICFLLQSAEQRELGYCFLFTATDLTARFRIVYLYNFGPATTFLRKAVTAFLHY